MAYPNAAKASAASAARTRRFCALLTITCGAAGSAAVKGDTDSGMEAAGATLCGRSAAVIAASDHPSSERRATIVGVSIPNTRNCVMGGRGSSSLMRQVYIECSYSLPTICLRLEYLLAGSPSTRASTVLGFARFAHSTPHSLLFQDLS